MIHIVDKYMLCRRILDGTSTSIKINYSSLTPRQRVCKLKSISNKFTFRSPNYNPAGIRKATFDDQILIVHLKLIFTSFSNIFKDEADMQD